MRIKNIEFRKLRILLSGTFKVAFGEINYSENVLLRITTDEGITGYGEAAPLAFVTGETPESVIAILEMLRPGLIGLNPLAVDDIHSIISGAVHGNSSARCAIDLALHDIHGKALGKPVYHVLGGGNGVVQNDITIGLDKPDEMARKAKYYTEEKGYRILKIKAGIDPAEDIRTLRLIRETVGPTIRLRVDANQGYSVSEAIGVLAPFRELGVEAIEQCLPDWDFEGAAYVRSKAAGIQLMLDESIHGPREAARACKLGAADALNIKLMKCGGLYPAGQISAIAAAHGLSCMVGCMIETRLAITAGLSLAAAKHNITDADCDSFLYYDNAQTGVSGGFTIEGDMFRLSDAPGFGVDVDF
ncbi:MAG: dipeptide epimerase [Treponema sp.]|nr:dipeptide epimerase [Treponema sp.]